MHVRLLEPLTTAKLTRKTGDYLCTSQGGTNGSWIKLAEAWDEVPEDFTQPVNCKACLKIARRWTPN
jgi:hypothetical protein